MVQHVVDEVAVGGEAGVVPVVDVVAQPSSVQAQPSCERPSKASTSPSLRDGSVRRSTGIIVARPVEPAARYTSLANFEACVEKAAAWLGARP